MRSRSSAWVRGYRLEVVAALAGVLLVLAAVAALHGGHAGPRHAQRHNAATRAHAPANPKPASAIHAATTDLIAFGTASLAGTHRAERTIDSIAMGPLRTRLARALPAVAGALRARIKKGHAAAAFDGWPLGYRLISFGRGRAMVAVWHLDVAASSALQLQSVDYATTTYRLRFFGGDWRIVDATTHAGPTPPAAGASTGQLNSFARAASSFSPYRYVP
jgi:hypothetical protein